VIFSELALKGAFVVDLDPHDDERGFFARTFCQQEFAAHGLNPTIAQANIAFNRLRGTLRGLHFQYPPLAETKVVRVIQGRCWTSSWTCAPRVQRIFSTWQ
jgi:dTDP-4-dehydrorhamnose 3,5-epimerase